MAKEEKEKTKKATTKTKKNNVAEKKEEVVKNITKKESENKKKTSEKQESKKTETKDTTSKTEKKASNKKDSEVSKNKSQSIEKNAEKTPTEEKNIEDDNKEAEDENKELGIGYIIFLIMIGVFVVALIVSVVVASLGRNTNSNNDREVVHKADKEMEVIIESEEEIAKKTFNGNLEFYVGEEDGYATKSLLDEVVKRMEENSDHSLVVTYDDEEVSDIDGAKEIKDKIKNKNNYEVEVEHSEDGYVNKIIITKED